jgi:hypothetical protein
MLLSGLSSLVSFLQITFGWTAQINGPTSSISYNPTVNQNSLNPKTSYTTGSGSGQCNEGTSTILSIAANGSANLDLTNLTDFVGATGVTLARIKAYFFRLLSAAQDAVNGTPCASITVGNGGNPNPLNLSSGTYTFQINNGAQAAWSDPGATGIVVSGTAKIVKIVNNDGTYAAAIQYGFLGATS